MADQWTNLNVEVNKVLKDLIRYTTIYVGIRLLELSPVGDPDTWVMKPPPGYVGGQFKANWFYGDGLIPPNTTNAIDPTGAVSLARIASTTGSYGQHYIVNNLPYASMLEYGWSKQAPYPPGITRAVGLEAGQIFVRAARAVKAARGGG